MSDCVGAAPAPGWLGSERGVASASAIGTMNSSRPPNTSSAFCQPTLSISATPNGANRNWPNEPAAVPAPIASMR